MKKGTQVVMAGNHRGEAPTDSVQVPQRQFVDCPADEKTRIALARLMRALPWVLCLTALVFGSSYLCLSKKGYHGSSFAIWIFLGFCALVVVGQLLPIFGVKLPPGKEKEQQESAPHEE